MSVPGPVLGPCTSWITADDVSACCSAEVASSDQEAQLQDAAGEASMLLYEVSGRQFSGLCGPIVARPCRSNCGCWGPVGSNFRWWSAPGYGWGWWGWGPDDSEGCGDRCGCGVQSYVRLAGYPVREVTEVKIDGDVVDPSAYELVLWRKLQRIDGSLWPACQNLGLPDDQPGTFSVTYVHGVDPPLLGMNAAAELACEIYSACTGGACKLPSRVVEVVRQGVTFRRSSPMTSYLMAGATGLESVDLFVSTYGGFRRRAAVYSPDLQPFARREV